MKLISVLAFSMLGNGRNNPLSDLDDIIPVPDNRMGKYRFLTTSDVVACAEKLGEQCCSLLDSDVYYRSDYLPDRFIEQFRGTYWNVQAEENSLGLCSDGDPIAQEFLNEFFYEEVQYATEENMEVFFDTMKRYLSMFIGDEACEEAAQFLISKHRGIYIDTDADGKDFFKNDAYEFEYETLNALVDHMRFSSAGKGILLSTAKSAYAFSAELTDEEILDVVEKLSDQPAMVQFNNLSETGPLDYVILQSKSLGFLLWNEKVYKEKFSFLPKRYMEELTQFYSVLPKSGVIFPYHHFANARPSVYLSEKIYIVGLYAATGNLVPYASDAEGCLSTPCLKDIVLLQWADKLYETIKRTEKRCRKKQHVKKKGE